MVTLGEKVKDDISGFSGTVTAIARYLNGCVYICVEGKMEKGQKREHWFDVQRLKSAAKTKRTKIVKTASRWPRPGGPQSIPHIAMPPGPSDEHK